MHGTETWKEVLCLKEETGKNSWVMAGKNKGEKWLFAAWWEPALGVFLGSRRALALVDQGVRGVALIALGESARDRQVRLERHLSVHDSAAALPL